MGRRTLDSDLEKLIERERAKMQLASGDNVSFSDALRKILVEDEDEGRPLFMV